MKLDIERLVCPKCKREYQNIELLSFHSKFYKTAKSFFKKKKDFFIIYVEK